MRILRATSSTVKIIGIEKILKSLFSSLPSFRDHLILHIAGEIKCSDSSFPNKIIAVLVILPPLVIFALFKKVISYLVVTEESEKDEKKLSAAENKLALLHPARIREISQYILDNFRIKTHRGIATNKGFNAMLAVSSIDAAKCYYEELKVLQKDSEKQLKIATIFSFAANEEQSAIGEILDENFEPTALELSAKEFLTSAINDYNGMFKTNFGVDSRGFQNYYRDLAKRVKNREIDIVIVVGMFLTGFDAPALNTLFVDKNLRYHGLIQAFSRTNRIFDTTKTFGNIVTFRDLEQHTIDAITLFGDSNTRNVVLERSYKEYLEGFNDIISGEARRGYVEVVNELNKKYPHKTKTLEKAFAKLTTGENKGE